MPRISDDIEHPFLPALRETLAVSTRATPGIRSGNGLGWRVLAEGEGAPR
ncbi:MAG: hypothetical protein ACNA8S_09515 [Deferrisomatales bacterium]